MVRHTTTDDATADADFAPEYREDRESINPGDVTYSRHGGLGVYPDVHPAPSQRTALEFEYSTAHGNTKTVRAIQATAAFDRDRGLPDDTDAYTFYDGSDGFAVTDTMSLFRRGDDHTYRRVADDVDVFVVALPDPAPVTGAVQDNVSVTVHYRSSQSGNMKTIRLDDVSVDWDGNRVRGHHARRDRTVEVEAVHERSVVSKSFRGGDREVGKCARIDFPAGHSFTVDAYNVPDDDAGRVHAAIEEAVRMVDDDYDADVTPDGRIED